MGTAGRGVAISLFSGAGGLDLGAEQAGCQVKAAVELDRDAATTLEKFLPHRRRWHLVWGWRSVIIGWRVEIPARR